MNGNVYDYLIPVSEAGDKSFTNGKQDEIITVEKEKKARELLKEIAMKKQLELERGNSEHLLEVMGKDTPDAAIYRALLLQQMENTKAAKKREEDKKPGIIKRAAIGTAKFVGNLALRYLVMQALFKGYDIYKGGVKSAWQKWLAENGVAKTPDLAEATGDATAAVGDDIMRRNVDFKDLTENQQKAFLSYAKDNNFYDKINTENAKFNLQSVFKKDGEYFESLPEGADASEFTREWAPIFNSGGKDAVTVPIAKDEVGSNLYNSMFKVGNVRTLITEDDNWFTGNPTVRAVDNSLTHFADLTGRNELKRKAYNDTLENYGVPESKKQFVDPILQQKRIDDAVEVATGNVNNVLANMRNPAWFNEAKFDIDPEKLDKVIDQVLGMKRTKASADAVFKALNPNTNRGINQSDLIKFITESVKTKLSGLDKQEKMSIYRGLKDEYNKTAIGSLMGNPFLKGSYDPGYEFNLPTERVTKDAVAATAGMTGIAGLTAAAVAGTASAPISVPLSIAALVGGVLFGMLN